MTDGKLVAALETDGDEKVNRQRCVEVFGKFQVAFDAGGNDAKDESEHHWRQQAYKHRLGSVHGFPLVRGCVAGGRLAQQRYASLVDALLDERDETGVNVIDAADDLDLALTKPLGQDRLKVFELFDLHADVFPDGVFDFIAGLALDPLGSRLDVVDEGDNVPWHLRHPDSRLHCAAFRVPQHEDELGTKHFLSKLDTSPRSVG